MFWAVFGSLVLISISLHYFYVTLVAFTYWKRRGVEHETPTYPLGNLSLSEIISTPTKDLMKGLYRTNKTDGTTLDFYSLIKRYLVDVMAAVLLGINVDYVNNPKDDVRFMSEEAIPPTGRTAFTLFFSYLAPGIKRKLHYNFFRKEVQNFVVGLVESVMKFRDDNPTGRFDFLHKLMEMRENGKTPKGFSIEVLSAQLLFIILAGYEATGTAISFCLWELARNPMVQARAQEEVDRIIAQHDGKFTLEALKQMTYIDNCLSETLRLNSPLTFLIRICNEDYHCEKHNLVIEKNTTIIVPLPGLHRDEKYYVNANKFNPDRFLPEEKAKRKQLAKLINTYTVGSLLRRYTLKLVENSNGGDLKLKPMTPLLSPVGGSYLTLIER
uniref:Cytochrome n=1 Tax=Lutzomyia longipalpis TaxID=7200 RepID=A0A1B0CN49_LUTLO